RRGRGQPTERGAGGGGDDPGASRGGDERAESGGAATDDLSRACRHRGQRAEQTLRGTRGGAETRGLPGQLPQGCGRGAGGGAGAGRRAGEAPEVGRTGAGDSELGLVGADVDATPLRAGDTEEVRLRGVRGGARVDRGAPSRELEVPAREVDDLRVHDRDPGLGAGAVAERDVGRQGGAGTADVEVSRLVVEADDVADDRVVAGVGTAAGDRHRLVDDDPAGRLVLRVRLDAVVLALVDDVVRDDAVARGLGRVHAVDQLLVAGLPQSDVVDQVGVDQDVLEVALVPEVNAGAALPRGALGQELADRVDVAADDLHVRGVDRHPVAEPGVQVPGDLEALDADVLMVELDSGFLLVAVVALDRGAPLVLGLHRDVGAGRSALRGEDVALVGAVSDEHRVARASDAHAARDGGLRGPRGEAVVVVVPTGGDVDRLRFGVGRREQLDSSDRPRLPGRGSHADGLRGNVVRLLVGRERADVVLVRHLRLGGAVPVRRGPGGDVPVRVHPREHRVRVRRGDRDVRGAGAGDRVVPGRGGGDHGVRPALHDHA